MAEWFKAAVLKTVERKFRGFESYSLRQFCRFAEPSQTFFAASDTETENAFCISFIDTHDRNMI